MFCECGNYAGRYREICERCARQERNGEKIIGGGIVGGLLGGVEGVIIGGILGGLMGERDRGDE